MRPEVAANTGQLQYITKNLQYITKSNNHGQLTARVDVMLEWPRARGAERISICALLLGAESPKVNLMK